MEGSPAGLAFTTGQPVFVDRPDLERFYSDYSRKAFETGVRSGSSIPLIAHGRKLGTLGMASMQDNAFSKEDIELLCQIANQIAIAVENSLNYEQARKAERDLAHSLDELNLLLGVANSVTSNLDLREVFKAIAECLRKVIKCDGMVMTILDRDARELRVFALDPNATILPPFSEGQRVPFAGTPAERAIGSLKTVIVTREELQSSTSPLVKQISALGIQTGCIAPLVSHGNALGTLAMVSLQESAFSQDDAELLSQIAKQIAIAVENALNFERAREAEKEAQESANELSCCSKSTIGLPRIWSFAISLSLFQAVFVTSSITIMLTCRSMIPRPIECGSTRSTMRAILSSGRKTCGRHWKIHLLGSRFTLEKR
jgi:formate hydrogenlyase transcriptional activator